MRLDLENLDSACRDLSIYSEGAAKTFEGFFSSLLQTRSRITRLRNDVATAAGVDVADCSWLCTTADGLTKVVSLPLTRLTSTVQMRDTIEQRVTHVLEGFDLLRSAPEDAQSQVSQILKAQVKSIADTLSEVSASSMRSSESLAEGIESAIGQVPGHSNSDAGPNNRIIDEAQLALQKISQNIKDLQTGISELGDHAKSLSATAAKMKKICDGSTAEATSPSLLAELQQLYTSDVEHEIHRAELQRNSFPH